jgi:alpha-tubulin suppressor-like RCC1 family protein
MLSVSRPTLALLLLHLTLFSAACDGCAEADPPVVVRPGADMAPDLEPDLAPDVAPDLAPAPVATVEVTPATSTVEVGDELALSVVVKDAAGQTLTDRRVEWITSNRAVARVNGMGVVTTSAPGTATIEAIADQVRGQAQITVTPLVVANVTLTPDSATMMAGQTLQLQLSVTNKTGKAITMRGVTWRSSAPTVATVNGSGFVVSGSPGQAIISAEVDGVVGECMITVSDVPVNVVRFVTADPLVVELEQEIQARVTVEDAAGRELMNRQVTWSTGDPAIATVGSGGLVRGQGLGQTTLVAEVEGVRAQAVVEVVPQPVLGMLLRPDGTTLREGESVQLTATPLNRTGQPLMGRVVSWRSMNMGVATVDADGLVTAVSPGTAQIEAESEGVSRAVSVQVIPRVASVQVAPDMATLTLSVPNAEAVQLVATPRSSTDAPLVRPVVWTSSDPAIASVSATGLVQAVQAGQATISATSEGVTGSALITVLPPPVQTVTVTPQVTSLFVGQTAQLSATTRAFNNMVLTGRAIAWTSSDPAIASVDAMGVVTAHTRGRVTITASSEGKSGSAPVVVSAVWTHISAGVDRSCGVSGGVVYCWGRNAEGSLGINDAAIPQTLLPAQVFGNPNFTQLSMRGLHSCALDDMGRAWCWGWNATSQLGTGDQQRRPAPTLVNTAQTFTTIRAGGTHTCALDGMGRAWCWGDNTYGQLGDDTTLDKDVPIQTQGGRAWSRLATGGNHTCAIEAGTDVLYCWGRNDVGQLGTGVRDMGTGELVNAVRPVAVGGATRFVEVAAGSDHTCALDRMGRAWCWGDNSDGKLGDGTQTQRDTPVLVSGMQSFTQLGAGAFHTCAMAAGGQLWCWGANQNGQLGTGVQQGSTSPVQVTGGLTFTAFSLGSLHTCGIASTGAAYCWGYNLFGSLGESTTQDKRQPFPVVLP